MEVAQLPHAADNLFRFHAVHRSLNCCIGGDAFPREPLLDLTNGLVPAGPKSLHNLEFQFRKFGVGQERSSYMCLNIYYRCMRKARGKIEGPDSALDATRRRLVNPL